MNVHSLALNPISTVKAAKEFGLFDLVFTGGLFDYLSEKCFIFMLRHIFNHLLKKQGKLFFTNISDNNPFRPWMNYLVSWNIIERSKSEIIRLIETSLGPQAEYSLEIEKENVGLTYLVEIPPTLHLFFLYIAKSYKNRLNGKIFFAVHCKIREFTKGLNIFIVSYFCYDF